MEERLQKKLEIKGEKIAQLSTLFLAYNDANIAT